MTHAHPSRLRADRALPQALREALRELPNTAPEPAQLAELRQQLGLAAPAVEAPVHPVPVSDRRLKERRLRRTVVALVFFPIAATAAVGTAIDLHQRSALSAAAAAASSSAAARVRSHAQVGVHGSPLATSAPTIASEALALPAAPEPAAPEPAASAASAAPLPRTAPSSALVSRRRVSVPRTNEPLGSESAATELALLQRANAALKSDPAQALALASEHRQLFPAGNLAQEREVIAIKALVAQGDSARAREGLTRFERSYPRSAHALELHRIVR